MNFCQKTEVNLPIQKVLTLIVIFNSLYQLSFLLTEEIHNKPIQQIILLTFQKASTSQSRVPTGLNLNSYFLYNECQFWERYKRSLFANGAYFFTNKSKYPAMNIPANDGQSYKSYRIYMGTDEIGDIDQDCAIIFDNFSLLSWLSLEYKPLILSFKTSPEGIPCYHAKALKNRFEIQQRVSIYLFMVEKIPEALTYIYFIQEQPPPMRNENKIVVRFQKGPTYFFIEINDFQGYFQRILDPSDRQRFVKKRGPKIPNILQYRYQQPHSQRHRYEYNKDHFHLAFKGGGAKGVGYVGAYKAITELYPNAMIRSIVGSSAGGMIALAISAGASIEELSEICLKMNDIPKQRVVNTMGEVTPQIQQRYDCLIAIWRQVLHDHGILTTKMYDLFAEYVFDDEVLNKIFDILTGDHQAMKTMFSIEKQKPIYQKKCCFSKPQFVGVEKQSLLVNYYGFLEGHLLKGDGVVQICGKVLAKAILQKYHTDRNIVFHAFGLKPNYVDDIESNINVYAQKLTMLQYYKLNGVEFTCTATDLDDKILRFLNHKTAPHVPVCKAVQMTSSYPIAFEALHWKRQWGKYYIHYRAFRRQIDLTGHQFTDGGLLCNFPIKFLDNEEIRPYYFSHAPNFKTHIFGFGLSQMPPQEDSPEQKRLKELNKEQLSAMIKKRMPKAKLLHTQLFQRPASKFISTEEMASITEIPLVKFAQTLIQTYIQSNENFAKECFAGRMYLFPETIQMGEHLLNKRDPYNEVVKKVKLRDALALLYQQLQTIDCTYENLYKFMKTHIYNEKGVIDDQSLVFCKNTLIKNLKDYALYHSYIKRIMNKPPKQQETPETEFERQIDRLESVFSDILAKTKKVRQMKVFPRTNTFQEDLNYLMRLIDKWYRNFETAGNKNSNLRKAMVYHIQNFFEFARKQANANIQSMLFGLDERISQLQKSVQQKSLIKNKRNQLLQSMSRFSKSFIYKNFSGYKKFIEALDQIDPFSVQQQRQFQARREDIYEFIEILLSNENSPNIHLVFQSEGVLAKFYLDTYRLVNEYIFASQTRKTAYLIDKITMLIIKANERVDPNYTFNYEDLFFFIVTKSDLHKFVMANLLKLPMLIDLGYVKFQIQSHLHSIIQTKIKERKESIRRITNITCSSMHSVTAFMLAAGFSSNRIMAEIINIKNLIEIDPVKIERDFYNMDWNLPFKCKIRQFQDVLWKNRFDMFNSMEYYAQRNDLSGNMKNIMREFQNSKDMIQDSFYTILDYVVSMEIQSDSRPREKTYEQFMAEKLSLKYGEKNYKQINEKIGRQTKKVLQILYKQYLSLFRHIFIRYSTETEVEYMAHCQNFQVRQAIWKGIIMTNFINADKLKLKIQDLLIQLNLPKDIKLKQFYDVCPVKLDLTFTAVDITAKCIQFINRYTYPQMPVWAAIMISSTFSTLLTPIKSKPEWSQTIDINYQKRYLNAFFTEQASKQPIFVSGNLLSNIPIEYLTNRKIQELYFDKQKFSFLTFGINHKPRQYLLDRLFYRSFLKTGNAVKFFLTNFKYVEMAPLAELHLLSSYVNGEDNLTLQIYEKELLSLPIRLSTLDFHKFEKPGVLNDIIEENYYYTVEKFCLESLTFLKVILRKGALQIKFISKQYQTTDLLNKYNVEFRTEVTPVYEYVKKNIITLPFKRKYLFLKFTYVDFRFATKLKKRLSIFQSEYQLDISKFEVFEYYEAIYGFQFGSAINGYLVPQKTPFVVFLPEYQNSFKTIPKVIFGKSIIDLEISGLYCELCCSPLKSKSKHIMAIANLLDDQCNKCKRTRSVKYVCENKYGGCKGRYCMRCCKKQVVFRTPEMFYCNEGHEYLFQNKTEYILRSEQVIHSRCDICLEYTDSYFYDGSCDNTMCQACSSQFIFRGA